jgi:hypothetical protein
MAIPFRNHAYRLRTRFDQRTGHDSDEIITRVTVGSNSGAVTNTTTSNKVWRLLGSAER